MTEGTFHTPLGPGDEFDRIRGVWSRLAGQIAPGGDDCAVVTVGDVTLAISTDMSVEGTHFLAGWLSLEEVGYRAAAAALSDLAAVAASPLGVLASVGISSELPDDAMAEIMSGVASAAVSVDAEVLGGDTVRSPVLVVDVTVLGLLDAEPLKRAGASPGDELYVTGVLGGPGAAVAAWRAGREPDAWARERFARPVPRVREARWLRDRGATALIDLSDGLAPDASHLAAASGAACVLRVDDVPGHPLVDPLAATASGEEYELLVALPGGAGAGAARDFQDRFELPLSRVGAVEAGKGLRVERAGVLIDDLPVFRHF